MQYRNTSAPRRTWNESGHASLCLLGVYLRRIDFFQPLEAHVKMKQKVLKFTEVAKARDVPGGSAGRSQSRQHEFTRGYLVLDVDLSPLPASSAAEGSERGYMGRCRSGDGAQTRASASRRLARDCLGNGHLWSQSGEFAHPPDAYARWYGVSAPGSLPAVPAARWQRFSRRLHVCTIQIGAVSTPV